MHNFKKLKVWEKSQRLTLDIYKATSTFPKHEIFALTSQMRRAAYSVPSNIAEGAGRSTHNEFLRFLRIALGSASELSYFILLSKDLKYIPEEDYRLLNISVDEVSKMIQGLIKNSVF